MTIVFFVFLIFICFIILLTLLRRLSNDFVVIEEMAKNGNLCWYVSHNTIIDKYLFKNSWLLSGITDTLSFISKNEAIDKFNQITYKKIVDNVHRETR